MCSSDLDESTRGLDFLSFPLSRVAFLSRVGKNGSRTEELRGEASCRRQPSRRGRKRAAARSPGTTASGDTRAWMGTSSGGEARARTSGNGGRSRWSPGLAVGRVGKPADDVSRTVRRRLARGRYSRRRRQPGGAVPSSVGTAMAGRARRHPRSISSLRALLAPWFV